MFATLCSFRIAVLWDPCKCRSSAAAGVRKWSERDVSGPLRVLEQSSSRRALAVCGRPRRLKANGSLLDFLSGLGWLTERCKEDLEQDLVLLIFLLQRLQLARKLA